jgi:DNA-binding PadR family transcriptional regulator
MLPKQLVAASVRPIMLTLLAEDDLYGYQLLQPVHTLSEGKINWAAGKLYPLLHDLENMGQVEAYWRPSEAGPDRKYYRLTPAGHQALERARQDWLDLNAILVRLWGPALSLG